ncbi:MAG: type II secretion system protein [Clostridiales bacterium]|nr:type II secretion system protein [Clostridiales bacterium]MBR5937111.1 type II secretion system protein [Clostridiales bacterium]
MKKIQKNKKGFTLVEMVLVIAIIVILAAVVFFSVSSYLAKARSATAKIESHNDAIIDVTAAIDAEL